jgi:hypothetical protein
MPKQRIQKTDKNGKLTHVWVGSDKVDSGNTHYVNMPNPQANFRAEMDREDRELVIGASIRSAPALDQIFRILWAQHDSALLEAAHDEEVGYEETSVGAGFNKPEPRWDDVLEFTQKMSAEEADQVFADYAEDDIDQFNSDVRDIVEVNEDRLSEKWDDQVIPHRFNVVPPFSERGNVMDRRIHEQYIEGMGIDPNGQDDTVFGTDYIYCNSHLTTHEVGYCSVRNEYKAPLIVKEDLTGRFISAGSINGEDVRQTARDYGFRVRP